MSKSRWVLIGLVVIVFLSASFALYWTFADRPQQPLDIVELQRTLVDIADEDELKQELEIIHPVLPPRQAVPLSTICNPWRSRSGSPSW